MDKSMRPTPPPEGTLITTALKQAGISARKAATRAGISDARWRQITSGYQTVSGTQVPVSAPADTLARMAQVVGVTPHQLEEAGRADAAAELRTIAVQEAAPSFSDEESWVLRDPRAQAILALNLPLKERIQGVRDLVEADLRRLQERAEQDCQAG